MKKFNRQIEISFEVDAIANQLRSMFKDDSANADIVVEQIIGRSLAKDMTMLSKIVAGMNGFQKEVPLYIGKNYSVKPFNTYGYFTPESITNNSTVRGEITLVTVIEINPCADEEVKVSYEIPWKEGKTRTEERWISASYFSL